MTVHCSLPHRQLQAVQPFHLQAAELADGLSRLGPQCLRDDVKDGATACIPKLHGNLVVGEAGCPELDSPGTAGSR